MSDPTAWQGFRKEIEEAQDLLKSRRDRSTSGGQTDALASALPSLLEQCREMIGSPDAGASHPLCSIHHFACTGGTLITRCIAAMPNTQVLSEVDPLSPMAHKFSFVPTDLIGLAKLGSRPSDQDVLIKIFLAGLNVLAREARQSGVNLILRDHAHSQFCYGSDIPDRPTLRDMLISDHTLRALVSVRHPLDSYLSLGKQKWVNFTPGNLEEYAGRYLAFLDRYDGVDILRYEDFVADPETQMQRICEAFALGYNADFQHLYPALCLSGDSGRKGGVISARPRRRVPEEVKAQTAKSATYGVLCARLGYDSALG